jgi:hypothetical protein
MTKSDLPFHSVTVREIRRGHRHTHHILTFLLTHPTRINFSQCRNNKTKQELYVPIFKKDNTQKKDFSTETGDPQGDLNMLSLPHPLCDYRNKDEDKCDPAHPLSDETRR